MSSLKQGTQWSEHTRRKRALCLHRLLTEKRSLDDSASWTDLDFRRVMLTGRVDVIILSSPQEQIQSEEIKENALGTLILKGQEEEEDSVEGN